MPVEIDHQDVLQNLEFTVARFYRSNPDLTDFAVQQAYDALLDKYGAEQRGTQARARELNAIQQELRDQVEAMCEIRLGRAESEPSPDSLPSPDPIDLTILIRCLRKLLSSLIKWTKHNGRQGYLKFMSAHVP